MRIERLELADFRNIGQAELLAVPGVNIIWGDNAHGKTNLLEAIWLFTGAKSFRGSPDNELIRLEQPMASLILDFYAEGRLQASRIVISREKKAAFLNEIKQERVSRLAGAFVSVVFSPDHLSLIKDGPEKRRRLVDAGLCQAYPKYASLLEEYQRILRQRGALLRDIGSHASLLDTMEAWDEGLCRTGAQVMHMRARYIKGLEKEAQPFYSGISGGKESFSLRYVCSIGGEESYGVKELYQRFGTALRESRGEDLRLGQTSKGPHRDDMEVLVDERSARGFGSQGQQRSCVLALKLAECGILYKSTGNHPVVLLDDVMSELDSGRREFLLNQLSGRQVFITCCDKASFEGLNQGRLFEVKNGAIHSVSNF